MRKSDVAIDVSHPDAIEEICRVALQYRQPLVIGTTGHSAEQRSVIEKTAESLPVVFASNFSVGVNALFRSEEHTSELQSHSDLVCRLLLEKKKKKTTSNKQT